jgi:hypothetical protein
MHQIGIVMFQKGTKGLDVCGTAMMEGGKSQVVELRGCGDAF